MNYILVDHTYHRVIDKSKDGVIQIQPCYTIGYVYVSLSMCVWVGVGEGPCVATTYRHSYNLTLWTFSLKSLLNIENLIYNEQWILKCCSWCRYGHRVFFFFSFAPILWKFPEGIHSKCTPKSSRL